MAKLSTYLNKGVRPGELIIVIDSETIEKEGYWVFFYNSKKFPETMDHSFALAGNAPVIVDKTTGIFYMTGTARPVTFYMEEYERGNLNSVKL